MSLSLRDGIWRQDSARARGEWSCPLRSLFSPFSSSFPSPPCPWCFFLCPNVSTTQSQDVVLKRFSWKEQKRNKTTARAKTTFMLSFFFFFLSPPPGGFLSTTRFHKRKTQNGELLLTRVFAQIAFRKPKNKRGKQSLSTFHPPTLHHNSLTNVSTEKSYQIRQNIFIRKNFFLVLSLPPFPRI